MDLRARAGLTALLWLGALLPAAAARAVIQPGEVAPSIELQDLNDQTLRLDAPGTGVAVLLFTKPGDRHTSAAVAAINGILAQHPEIDRRATRRAILSRLRNDDQIAAAGERIGPGWPLLLDRDDAAYGAYRIIATPTLVIVGADGLVSAVHPGYDPGMAQAVRLALAAALGVELPAAATQAAAPPNMDLQMARRLAARGLWERALEYYDRLKPEDVTDAVRVERAAILLELGRLEDALADLTAVPADSPHAARAEELRRLVTEKQAGDAAPAPPAVTR